MSAARARPVRPGVTELTVLTALLALPAAAQQPPIEAVHVQGKVWMLVGAESNVAVQIGDDGILVVDPGNAATGEAVIAAIRALSDAPIRWIVNTHLHTDHTGANALLSQAGVTVNGNPAAIVGHENVLGRMAATDRPVPEWPLNTFFESQRDFYFNGEAIFLYHIPQAHTDGDILVYFRGSDVLLTGDLFVTTHFPIIDLDSGGGVNGFIAGLNKALDLTVPAFLQEGGTYVIPGHGRISDEADVVSYRNMILFVRDRVQHLLDQGADLDEVLDARPALDYEPRYTNAGIPWTTEMFIESVYRSLED
jgi:glyoxylase-like metal-dependent hydrolase (beta-lactamase superfamily II)